MRLSPEFLSLLPRRRVDKSDDPPDVDDELLSGEGATDSTVPVVDPVVPVVPVVDGGDVSGSGAEVLDDSDILYIDGDVDGDVAGDVDGDGDGDGRGMMVTRLHRQSMNS